MPKFPDNIKTLGQAVRYLRELRGLTLRALAKKVEVSAPFLSDLEHDRRSTEKLDKLARALEVQRSDLEKFHLTPELKEWLGERPEMIQLLREIRASGASAAELRVALPQRARRK